MTALQAVQPVAVLFSSWRRALLEVFKWDVHEALARHLSNRARDLVFVDRSP
jgi:hypothetical protein